jgi:hypothetical protein
MSPAADMLRRLAELASAQARDRIHEAHSANDPWEAERLAAYADTMDTARQLAKYGVSLE